MLVSQTFISIFEVVILIVPTLFIVALITIAERKTMASMQRRIGPNKVGWYGILQAFADAIKLLLKEYVAPTQSNIIIFFLGPILTLVFSLLGYAIIPYGTGLALLDFNMGILYILAISSLATYGILLAGWAANSKYAFLGSLRSTAQMVSYELILTSAILLVVMLSGTLSTSSIVENQIGIWFMIPLLPMFVVFFMGSIAETNRAPFDLAEAESELVSGFMTEHSAGIFVFFFLAEYSNIVLICIIISILFTAGSDFPILTSLIDNPKTDNVIFLKISHWLLEGGLYGVVIGVKTCFFIFLFIWVRASLPRIRFDQLMSYCWTILLPIVIAFIISIVCIIKSNNSISNNVNVL